MTGEFNMVTDGRTYRPTFEPIELSDYDDSCDSDISAESVEYCDSVEFDAV